MAIELRQSTAGQEIPIGYFLDSTDGNTEETGLTIANTDIKIWKWGATTLANKNSGGATHISNGIYYAVLDATDTNTLGPLVVFVHVSGALAARVECSVLTANQWDSKYSTDVLNVAVTEWNGVALGTTNPLPNAAAGAAGGLPTDSTGKTSFNDLSSAQVNAEADTALSDFFTSAAQLVDDIWDEPLTAAAHNVATSAGRRLRTLQVGGNYEGGAIWIDTVNGTAGTTVDENGTVTNPVDTIADALTLGAASGLRKIAFYPGSSITLAATVDGYEFHGADTPIALGGQSIASCRFFDCELTGISTGSAEFYRCKLGAATIAPGTLRECGIGYNTGTLTLGSAGNFDLINPHSLVAGAASPVIDMGAAVGATNLGIRNHHGGLTLNNLATGDVVTIGGLDLGAITLNGADAQVEIRGIKKATTNNLTGSPTVNDTALLKSDIDAILADTGELQTDDVPGLIAALNNLSSADVNAAVDSALDTAIPGVPTAGSINDVLSDLSALLPTAGTLLNDTDTFAEPSSIPTATATLPAKIGLIVALARNKVTQTATTQTLRNDADSADIGTASVSDDGTTFTKGKLA